MPVCVPKPTSSALPDGEQELKFHVPKSSTPGFRRWLDQVFLPHPSHGESTICSIYFDTPLGQSLNEKLHSDYAKTKYRVRWYADEHGTPLSVPAYIEIKAKFGATRRKYRQALPHAPEELMSTPLEDTFFMDFFPRYVPADVALPTAPLRPVLELRYARHRYVHSVFAESFCLDSDIRCMRTRPGTFPPAFGAVLPHDVFEQKGQSPNPLPILQALPRFDARRASISKYHETLIQLLPQNDFS